MVILYQFVAVVATVIIVVGIACGSNSLKFDIRPVVGITMFNFLLWLCNKSLQCGNIMARKQIALNFIDFFFSLLVYYSMYIPVLLNLGLFSFKSVALLLFGFVPFLILFSLHLRIISNDYHYKYTYSFKNSAKNIATLCYFSPIHKKEKNSVIRSNVLVKLSVQYRSGRF